MPHSVDALDLRILRAMGVQAFLHGTRTPDGLKASALAAAVGASVQTVRERVAQLEKAGILGGYEAYPNYRLFGLNVASYLFRVAPAARSTAMENVGEVDGVVCVMGFLGPEVAADIVHRGTDDLARKVRLLSKLMGDAQAVAYQEYRLPEPASKPTALDWRIIQALRGDGRRSPEEVAYYAGVSSKTVKRHLERLFADGLLDVVPLVHPGNITGSIMAVLLLSLDPAAGDRERAAILAAFDEAWFHQYSPPGSGDATLALALVAANPAEAEGLRREAESLPGVRQAELLIPNMIRGTEHWLDELIAERAVSSPAPLSH